MPRGIVVRPPSALHLSRWNTSWTAGPVVAAFPCFAFTIPSDAIQLHKFITSSNQEQFSRPLLDEIASVTLHFAKQVTSCTEIVSSIPRTRWLAG